MISIKAKIVTNDAEFPKTLQSKILVHLWLALYDEAFRETLYTASLAGIHSALSYSEYTGQFL